MNAGNAVYVLPWIVHGFFQLNVTERLQLNYNREKKVAEVSWTEAGLC